MPLFFISHSFSSPSHHFWGVKKNEKRVSGDEVSRGGRREALPGTPKEGAVEIDPMPGVSVWVGVCSNAKDQG